MTAEEFVKNFYHEKQRIFNSCFNNRSEYKTLVSTKIEGLNLNKMQAEKLKDIVSDLLTDTFYTLLLGLDGSATIGDSQESFRIHDGNNHLISECGDLEGFANEYFHENK